jgi:hypothetical protein
VWRDRLSNFEKDGTQPWSLISIQSPRGGLPRLGAVGWLLLHMPSSPRIGRKIHDFVRPVVRANIGKCAFLKFTAVDFVQSKCRHKII